MCTPATGTEGHQDPPPNQAYFHVGLTCWLRSETKANFKSVTLTAILRELSHESKTPASPLRPFLSSQCVFIAFLRTSAPPLWVGSPPLRLFSVTSSSKSFLKKIKFALGLFRVLSSSLFCGYHRGREGSPWRGRSRRDQSCSHTRSSCWDGCLYTDVFPPRCRLVCRTSPWTSGNWG